MIHRRAIRRAAEAGGIPRKGKSPSAGRRTGIFTGNAGKVLQFVFTSGKIEVSET